MIFSESRLPPRIKSEGKLFRIMHEALRARFRRQNNAEMSLPGFPPSLG
jgi:hypothetical protein